jgi:hypothetical protein
VFLKGLSRAFALPQQQEKQVNFDGADRIAPSYLEYVDEISWDKMIRAQKEKWRRTLDHTSTGDVKCQNVMKDMRG